MEIGQAVMAEANQLAELIILDTLGEKPAEQARADFTREFAQWWSGHQLSHLAFVARDPKIVGVAWIALLPRVPRPGSTARFSADVQSVYVLPEQRGRGLGSALVRTAVTHSERLGALRVTVHSGKRAVPIYNRLGFEMSQQLLMRSNQHP